MICGKCGNNCGDNEVFCGNCGAKLTPEAPAAPAPEQQYQAPAQPQYQAPAQPQYQAPAQPQYQQPYQQPYQAPVQPNGGFYSAAPTPVEKKKKSGKKAALITISIVLALALVAGAIIFIPKLFKSGGDKFKDIERTELSQASDGITSLYNEILPENDGSSLTTTLKISIDDSILGLLSQAGDFSWLSDIGIESSRATTDDSAAGDIILSIGGKKVLTADVKIDKSAGLIYVQIPELSDKYISFDSSALERLGYTFNEPDFGFGFNSYSGGASYRNIADLGGLDVDEGAIQAITTAFPDSDTLSGLIEKYGQIVIDSIGETTKEEKTLELNGLSQSCTSYYVNFDENQMKDTVKAVLEEVKNDKDIKDIVTKFAEAEAARYSGYDDWDYDDWDLDDAETYGDDDWDLDTDDLDDWGDDADDWGGDYNPDDAYDMFVQQIDQMLEEIDKTERSENPRTLFDYTVYTDSDDNVIGRDFELKDGSLIGIYDSLNYTSRMVSDSDKVALEIKLERDGESLVNISGDGSGSTDSYTGDCVVKAMIDGDDAELIKANFKEFSFDDVREGKLNGHVSVSLGKDLADQLSSRFGGDMTTSAITSMIGQFSLDLDFDSSGKLLDFDAAVSAAGQKLINVECRNSEGSKLDTRLPDRSDVVEYDEYDEESILEWVKDWDVDSFMDGLKDAGIPSEICDQIEAALGQITKGDDYDDWDTWDDDDDWDTWDGWDYDEDEAPEETNG